MDARISPSAPRSARSYAPMYASRARGLTYMYALAMGVGKQTWKRTPAGITPSACTPPKTR